MEGGGLLVQRLAGNWGGGAFGDVLAGKDILRGGLFAGFQRETLEERSFS